MAALDFPDTPAVGQLYGSAGTMWRWDGARWASTSGASGVRGRVAYAQVTVSQSDIPSMVATPLGGLSVTWTADPSRTYLITGSADFKGASGVEMDIYNNTTRVGLGSLQALSASYITSLPVSLVQSGLSGLQTRKLMALGLGGVVHTQQGPDYPAYIMVEDITYEAGSGAPAAPPDDEWTQFTLVMPVGSVVGGAGSDNRGWYKRIGKHTVHVVGTWNFGASGSGALGGYSFNFPVPPDPRLPEYSVIGNAHIVCTAGRYIATIHKVGAAFEPWGTFGHLTSAVPSQVNYNDGYYMNLTYPC